MMKRKISLLLVLLLCFGLCACGAQTEKNTAPEILCLPMEYGRLYTVSYAGEPMELLWDEACSCFDRQGDQIYAAFEDGTVRRYNGKTGEKTTLFTAEKPANQLRVLGENDLIFCNYSIADGGDLFRWRDGQLKQLLDDVISIYQLNVTDGVLVYDSYDEAEGDVLMGLELDSGSERWRIPGGIVSYRQDGAVYARCESGFCRVSGKDGSLTPQQETYDPDRFDLLHIGSGGSLVQDYGYVSGAPGVYFAAPNGMKKLELQTNEDSCSVQVLDAEGDLVLLRSYISEQCPGLTGSGGDTYYTKQGDYLVDTASGAVVKKLNVRSATTALFAEGDFPVLDSSTARKPVTHDLYRTFCLGPDIPGKMPVCNTTHGAWLALGDRTSDIALLAAPTEEEQAYLREKGVTVESKLYGGDGLVFIGNEACGVKGLTLEQVRAIYRGEIKSWSELGGADAPIRVLYREDQSGSQRLFERMVWGDEPVPDFSALGFEELDGMSGIVEECLADPYSVGYSIMTYLEDVFGEKDLLAFALDGVEAAPRTVADGTYPLSTQGYVVIRADEAADSPARRLYNWFGSPVCDEILKQNGVTPLHDGD